MPTLTDLDALVVGRLGVNSNDTRLTSSVRTRAINEAVRQVTLEADWPWLVTSGTLTTVVGTASYSVPSTWFRTRHIIHQDNGDSLLHRSLIDVDSYNISGRQGRPMIYTVEGSAILLGPVPDGVYNLTHRFMRTETALVSGSDSTLIPTLYSRGVVEWATSALLREIREMDRAVEADAEYIKWLKRTKDNIKQSREPYRVRVRPGSWI